MKTALVIDDHPVTHIGCSQLLQDAGYGDVFQAMTAHEAFPLAAAHRPTLIVLDLALPGLGGLGSIAPLLARSPSSRILVFSMNEQRLLIAKCLEAGARGYLSKNSAPAQFLKAVTAIEAGEVFLAREVAIALATMNIGGRADPLASLTEREHEVLRLVGEGRNLASIAEVLRISYKTAANTTSALKRKLGVHSTTELMRVALDRGG